MTLKEQLKQAQEIIASQQAQIEFMRKQLEESYFLSRSFGSLSTALGAVTGMLADMEAERRGAMDTVQANLRQLLGDT